LNRRYGSCFRQQNRILTFPAAEPAADSAATVQEAGWALVDSAWVVTVDSALVRFRVRSREIETSLAAIYNIFQRADIKY
jgi:hypothetical protein